MSKTPLTKQEQRELDEIFRWMAAYVNYCNRVLRFWEKHGTHIPNLYLEKSDFLKYMERKYSPKFDPDQPRVPRGNSDGGQWTDGGGGSTRTPTRKPSRTKLPRNRRPRLTAEELEEFNRRAPAGTKPEDLEIHPEIGLPRWAVDGRVNTVGNPLTDALVAVPAARAAGNIAKVTVRESVDAMKVLAARWKGRRSALESQKKNQTRG